MNKLTFEDVLAEKGELIYSHVGYSMYPLIKGERDLMVIKPVTVPLRRLDIPLYKRDNGKYIVHRIIKVADDGYVLCGDNCLDKEYGITDKHIIGVMTTVVRDGKAIPADGFKNRLYAHIICDFFPLRRLIFLFRRFRNFVLRR